MRDTDDMPDDRVREQIDEILGRLVSATYIVDHDGAHVSQHLITPEMLAEAKRRLEALIAAAETKGRIESIDEYLTHCDILMQEPSRGTLEAFQDGQRLALAQKERER